MPLVELSLTYDVDHIPARCRTPVLEPVRDTRHVCIQEISPESAPISHRILDARSRVKAEVRHHDGGYWWLLNDMKRPMSVDRFISLAKSLDWAVLDALDLRGSFARRTDNDLRKAKSRILRSDQEEQWMRAQAGANRILFCDSRVLVEAGPPNYFGEREGTSIRVEVGPSSLDRIRGAGPLYGPDLNDRKFSARKGLAFDVEEFDREAMQFEKRGEEVNVPYRIVDDLSMPVPKTAPERCARELAAYLWQTKSSRFAEQLPSLAGDLPDICPDDRALHRTLLQEFAALTEDDADPFFEELEDARVILHRIASPLTEEEDAALAAFAI